VPRRSTLVAAGAALASAALGAVLWKRWHFPVRERRRDVARLPDPPILDVPAAPGRPAVQTEADGCGPRFHRRYRVRIGDSALSPEEVIGRLATNPDAFVPTETARFEKTYGEPGPIAVGDEYEVHPTGPWRAPVRVAACDERSFTLATLEGHLEAGLIRFSAAPGSHGARTVVFTVESWARSATPAVNVAYDTLGVARAAQQATWTFLCQSVAAECGRRLGPVDVLTEREPEPEVPRRDTSEHAGEHAGDAAPGLTVAPPVAPERLGADVRSPRHRRPEWERYRDRIEALRSLPVTVDLAQRHTFTAEAGWHVDHTSGALPPEPPGEPLPAGTPGASWAAACRLVRDYAFPDPRLITGLFAPDGPVAGRPMLLRARFLGVTFWFGVRVGDEIDETVETPDGPARDWGYGYATLPGHFERGEITFRVRKMLRTGAVTFHIDAVSQQDRIANPFYRVGFAIFGRHLQRRFARTAVARMQMLTAEALASPRP
jgi:uncharacterized protein (UPF0548 family)